jgi:hypothetical protein
VMVEMAMRGFMGALRGAVRVVGGVVTEVVGFDFAGGGYWDAFAEVVITQGEVSW